MRKHCRDCRTVVDRTSAFCDACGYRFPTRPKRSLRTTLELLSWGGFAVSVLWLLRVA